MLRLLPADSVTEHSDQHTPWKAHHGDRRNAGLLRSIRRAKCIGVLYRLCRQGWLRTTRPADLCIQRRPGRGVGISASWSGRSAHSRFRTETGTIRARALRDNPDTWLAFTRSGPDRSDRHRMEPGSQARRRQNRSGAYRATPGRWPRPSLSCRQEQSRRLTEISVWRKLWRFPRRAKTARALQSEQGILISGIVVLSPPLLEGWLTFGDDQSALNAALQLPSLAAAELERKNAFSPDALAAAEKFAIDGLPDGSIGAVLRRRVRAARTFYEQVAKMAGVPG